MRKRIGNPSNEAHGKTMRCYDWIAPVGTNPSMIPTLIEVALPGLKLYHRGDNVVNGFVNTSRRPDGSLYISVHLYDTGCSDPECPGGHKDDKGKPIAIDAAPPLTPADEQKIKNAVRDHPQHKLQGTPADEAVLRGLGFLDTDGPLRE